MNAERLSQAVEFAKQPENKASRDLAEVIANSFGKEPFNEIVGPTKPRGDANGMVVRNGYIVAEWGDTQRVDMTFSGTKSYLSTVAGLALDEGLIRNLEDPLQDYVRDGKFDGDHNSRITWRHLLHQTSDWSGELWDKPDWADRPQGQDPRKWSDRQMHDPGTYFKYNDVRVNLLAYSLLNVWRRPLPVVLRERIMDPIGASPSWRWHGYENSWVTIDGDEIDIAGLEEPLKFRVGQHGLEVESEKYELFAQSFRVNRGENEPITVALGPKAAAGAVSSRLPAAPTPLSAAGGTWLENAYEPINVRELNTALAYFESSRPGGMGDNYRRQANRLPARTACGRSRVASRAQPMASVEHRRCW